MAKRSTFAVLTRKGKRLSSGVAGRAAPMVWTAGEVRKLARKRKCYTVVNLRTQKVRKVGAGCRKRRRR
jgi:hypothetical protein